MTAHRVPYDDHDHRAHIQDPRPTSHASPASFHILYVNMESALDVSNFNSMHSDLISRVFDFLAIEDLLQVEQCSDRFRQEVNQYFANFWR
jgi:hypothetical protein